MADWPEDNGFEQLAQTWSKPVVTKIMGWPEGNRDPELARPVIIFGGGYAAATKDTLLVGENDATGKAVFIVDAQTGQLVHSFGPSTSAQMTQITGITDSIPNAVAILDSDSDQFTDRIYASDTGGNVWRMDLPSESPKHATSPWTAFKFAALGDNELIKDIRFYSEPVVAQTIVNNVYQQEGLNSISFQQVPYDAVVIGTGLRPHPTDTNRQDMFFALQDRHITAKSFTGTNGQVIPAAITHEQLYDVTQAAPKDLSQELAFSAKKGWFYTFKDKGEKNLSAATILNGRVFFHLLCAE